MGPRGAALSMFCVGIQIFVARFGKWILVQRDLEMATSPSDASAGQLQDRIESALADRRRRGLLRQLRCPDDGMCDFSSNDYLGISKSDSFREFFLKMSLPCNQQVLPAGATGSRLLSGHSQLVEDLELKASRFHRAQAALVFNSGYDANVSVLSCLPGPDDAVVYDELIHASVHDGMRMSRARTRLIPFKHNDISSLENAVMNASSRCAGSIVICIETLYSMEGDIAPVTEILTLAKSLQDSLHREVYVIADEAHGGGLYGENGEGIVCSLEMEKHPNLLLRVVTFGKAFGAHGAVVLGSYTLRRYLVNYARPFIYSTALPPISILTLIAVYQFMESAQARAARKHLWDLVRCFHELRRKLLPKTAAIHHNNLSPIQAILVPGNRECVELSNVLRKRGFDVYPIRSPTVPKGVERIRIIIHAHNNRDEIRRLISATAQAIIDSNPRSKM